jgi:hypothetical protein
MLSMAKPVATWVPLGSLQETERYAFCTSPKWHASVVGLVRSCQNANTRCGALAPSSSSSIVTHGQVPTLERQLQCRAGVSQHHGPFAVSRSSLSTQGLHGQCSGNVGGCPCPTRLYAEPTGHRILTGVLLTAGVTTSDHVCSALLHTHIANLACECDGLIAVTTNRPPWQRRLGNRARLVLSIVHSHLARLKFVACCFPSCARLTVEPYAFALLHPARDFPPTPPQ